MKPRAYVYDHDDDGLLEFIQDLGTHEVVVNNGERDYGAEFLTTAQDGDVLILSSGTITWAAFHRGPNPPQVRQGQVFQRWHGPRGTHHTREQIEAGGVEVFNTFEELRLLLTPGPTQQEIDDVLTSIQATMSKRSN